MRYRVIRGGVDPATREVFECDELPEPLYTEPYVSVEVLEPIPAEAIRLALVANGAVMEGEE